MQYLTGELAEEVLAPELFLTFAATSTAPI